MVIRQPEFVLRLEVIPRFGRPSVQERRNILLSVFHQLNPLFNLIRVGDSRYLGGSIRHRDGSWQNSFRDEDRPIFLKRALKTETTEQKLGFEIRTGRLKMGMTQKNLADATGISRGHISRIEKGHHTVKPETLERLRQYLGVPCDNVTTDE